MIHTVDNGFKKDNHIRNWFDDDDNDEEDDNDNDDWNLY